MISQEVLKAVVDRFQKEHYGNSSMFPEDIDILDCVMEYFNIPKGGPHELYSLCSPEKLELYYHVRERRNRLSPLVRNGYTDWAKRNEDNALKVEG